MKGKIGEIFTIVVSAILGAAGLAWLFLIFLGILAFLLSPLIIGIFLIVRLT